MIIKNESVLNVQTLIFCIVAHIKPVNMTNICSSSSFCCFSQLRSGKKKKNQVFKCIPIHHHCAENGSIIIIVLLLLYYFSGQTNWHMCGASIKYIPLILCPSHMNQMNRYYYSLIHSPSQVNHSDNCLCVCVCVRLLKMITKIMWKKQRIIHRVKNNVTSVMCSMMLFASRCCLISFLVWIDSNWIAVSGGFNLTTIYCVEFKLS